MTPRVSALLAAAMLSTLSCDAADPVHALVIGDWGKGGAVQNEVARAMQKYAQTAEPPLQFVVSTGDNFYESGVTSVDDPQWKTKFEEIYDPMALAVPFYAVLGNHDWLGDPVAQIAYAQTHPGTRWRMPGFWYSRSFPENSADPVLDIFFVDTCLWTQNTQPLAERQRVWLTTSLAASRARWKLVVGHHPIHSDGTHGPDESTTKLRDILGPIFKSARVDAYVAGHDHDLQRIVMPDHPTLFLVSGAAGDVRQRARSTLGPFYASKAGFLTLHANREKLAGEFIGSDGAVLDRWHLGKE